MSRKEDYVKSNYTEFELQARQLYGHINDTIITRNGVQISLRSLLGFGSKLPTNPGNGSDISEQSGSTLPSPIITQAGQWFDNVYGKSTSDFSEIHAKWANKPSRTIEMNAEIKQKYDIAAGNFRQLYTGYIKKNPLLENGDIAGMGFKIAAGKRESIPAPTTFPTVELYTPALGVVDVHVFDEGSNRGGKPEDVYGIVIIWAILDEPTVEWKKLTTTESTKVSPFRLTFGGELRGKTVYVAACWENPNFKKGPWSGIHSVIIP